MILEWAIEMCVRNRLYTNRDYIQLFDQNDWRILRQAWTKYTVPLPGIELSPLEYKYRSCMVLRKFTYQLGFVLSKYCVFVKEQLIIILRI
jgi:hypothetical protein